MRRRPEEEPEGAQDFTRLGDLLGAVAGQSAGSAPATPAAGGMGAEPRAGDESGNPPRAGGPPVERGRGAAKNEVASRLAAVWPDVVGPEVAANAQPVHLRAGRLVVSASSAAWAQTLQMMEEAIAARLRERLGNDAVRQIAFRHAGWVETAGVDSGVTAGGSPAAGRQDLAGRRRRVPEGTSTALSAAQTDALAGVDRLDLAPELREKIKRAMTAAFVRGEQGSVR